MFRHITYTLPLKMSATNKHPASLCMVSITTLSGLTEYTSAIYLATLKFINIYDNKSIACLWHRLKYKRYDCLLLVYAFNCSVTVALNFSIEEFLHTFSVHISLHLPIDLRNQNILFKRYVIDNRLFKITFSVIKKQEGILGACVLFLLLFVQL